MGTSAEYCRRNGLNSRQFYAVQERLGLSKPLRKGRPPKAFVRVQASPAAATELMAPPRVRGLPDAKWVAELVLALMAQR